MSIDRRNEFIHIPGHKDNDIAKNATTGIKYIMPDEESFKQKMIEDGWTISRDDEEKIYYEYMEDGKVVYCKDYDKKRKSFIGYDPSQVVKLFPTRDKEEQS